METAWKKKRAEKKQLNQNKRKNGQKQKQGRRKIETVEWKRESERTKNIKRKEEKEEEEKEYCNIGEEKQIQKKEKLKQRGRK